MSNTTPLGRPTNVIPADQGSADDDFITIKISKKGAQDVLGTASDKVKDLLPALGDIAAKVTDKLLEKGPEAVGKLLGEVKTHAPELLPVISTAVQTLTGAAAKGIGAAAVAGAGSAGSALSGMIGQAIDDTKQKATDTMVNVATAPLRGLAHVAGLFFK